jgi:hypothetical protein
VVEHMPHIHKALSSIPPLSRLPPPPKNPPENQVRGEIENTQKQVWRNRGGTSPEMAMREQFQVRPACSAQKELTPPSTRALTPKGIQERAGCKGPASSR